MDEYLPIMRFEVLGQSTVDDDEDMLGFFRSRHRHLQGMDANIGCEVKLRDPNMLFVPLEKGLFILVELEWETERTCVLEHGILLRIFLQGIN